MAWSDFKNLKNSMILLWYGLKNRKNNDMTWYDMVWQSKTWLRMA